MISPRVYLGDRVEVTTLQGELVERGTLVNRNLPLVVIRRDDALSPGELLGINVKNYNVKRIAS